MVFALAMLNGPLNDATMLPYLDSLVAAGYKGICFHPRDGMLVPYASRHFWERLDFLVGESIKRGLEIWHYDEFPYPSGAFGNVIPETDPAARVRTLKFEEIEPKIGHGGLIDVGPGAFLALLRQGENGEWRDVSEDCGPHMDTWVWGPWHNRYYTGTVTIHEELHERASADRFTTAYLPSEPLQNGEKLLAVKIETMAGQKGGAGQPDITLPEVTDRFLEAAYKPLAEISRRHGLENTPVFQDEVTFHAPFLWNRLVEAGLKEIWGEDWKIRLSGLYSATAPQWEETRLDFRRLTAKLLEENWFARVAQFCTENGLQMTGHLPGEESIVGHWNYLGDAFKNLRHFPIPGYDIISSTIPDDLNRGQALGAKILQSAAWLDGKKPTMAEVFGAHGFHADLQKNRSVVAWLALHDITQIFDHSTYSCALSVRKYDAPPVNNRFNPLWRGREDLWKWHEWFCELLEEFKFSPDTLILFPSESLARFQMSEWDDWTADGSFLETWFHYAFARSLDTILVPSEMLDEIEIVDEGFKLRGHVYKDFWVPPVPMLHIETAQKLEKFGLCPRFKRFVGLEGQTVFGGGADLVGEVVSCSERELLEKGAAFFRGKVQSCNLDDFSPSRTLLKTFRRNERQEEILILLNPHDEAMQEVSCGQWPGHVLASSVGGLQPRLIGGGQAYWIDLAPREVVVFDRTEPIGTSEFGNLSEIISCVSPKIRCLAPNHFSLKTGVLILNGEEKPFQPAPVSSIFQLDVPYNLSSDAVYGPPYSLAPLPEPTEVTARFSMYLNTDLGALEVVWDEESLPPGAVVKWDETPLRAEKRNVFERGNQVFPIPAALLTAGEHVLSVEAQVTSAAQGFLERPILTGRFLVSPDGTLRAANETWSDWNGETASELGYPEGFGPWNYEFSFFVEDDGKNEVEDWYLALPPHLGISEISLNGDAPTRFCWEPRHTLLSELQWGENRVQIRVFGTWNNLFSSLNRSENGLTAAPVLRRYSQ